MEKKALKERRVIREAKDRRVLKEGMVCLELQSVDSKINCVADPLSDPLRLHKNCRVPLA